MTIPAAARAPTTAAARARPARAIELAECRHRGLAVPVFFTRPPLNQSNAPAVKTLRLAGAAPAVALHGVRDMSKKLILALGILVSAPFALLNCSASGAGSIGDADGSASSGAGDRDNARKGDPVESETTTTRTTTTTTKTDD